MKLPASVDLEQMLSSSTARIYWLDHNNVYQGCNETVAKELELSSCADIVGKKNKDLPWGKKNLNIVSAWDKNNLEVMTTRIPALVEEASTLPDGTNAIFLSHKIPLLDSDGKVIGLFGISTDITKLSLETAKLKEEKEQAEFTLDYVMAHLPAHIYCKDKNGVYIASNDQQAISLGLKSGKEIVGKTDFELPWGKEQAQVFRENDLEVMRTGIAKMAEEPAIVNGHAVTVLSQKVPLKNKQGKIVGVLGVSIDITAQKQIAALQQEKKELAEKAIRFMNVAAGAIVHELRTPLAAISVQMDVMNYALSSTDQETTQQEKDNTYKQTIKLVKGVVKSTAHLISDILIKLRSFAAGKVTRNNFDTLLIASDVDEFLGFYPFEGKDKKLVKLKNFDSLEHKFKYVGDSMLTRHVLSNLLENSLDATKEAGKGEITIELRVGDDGDKFNYLIFTDTASGISKELMPQVFNQFELKTTTHGGTGLGLAFCKMVMESYGGDIKCESIEGKYTSFTLSFPKIP